MEYDLGGVIMTHVTIPRVRNWTVVLWSATVGLVWAAATMAADVPAPGERRLAVAVYRDKMKGAWLGQMAGVGWGQPTEFNWKAQIIPEDKMPPWNPAMINQHGNDDLYVEMTFLKTLETYGLDVSIRQAGIDFANSGYQLWHANTAGRENLCAGIAPPDSGHPKFNKHADDIDYQIEADFSGLIAPGMPNVAIALGEMFGRLMNYGDGLYGGQFVGGMYAEAFFETDPAEDRRGRPAVHPRREPVRRVRPRRAPLAHGRTRRLAEDLAEDRGQVPEGPGVPPGLVRQGRLQHRRQDQRRLHRDGPALRQARPRPDDRHRLPLRPGQRLQSVQRRRGACSPRWGHPRCRNDSRAT